MQYGVKTPIEYHRGRGHQTERCVGLEGIIQDMLDNKRLQFLSDPDNIDIFLWDSLQPHLHIFNKTFRFAQILSFMEKGIHFHSFHLERDFMKTKATQSSRHTTQKSRLMISFSELVLLSAHSNIGVLFITCIIHLQLINEYLFIYSLTFHP